jgi:uncharacterized RDD family membrane protein YckC
MAMRDHAASQQGRRAGIVSRITADAIDLVVIFVIYFCALVVFAGVRYLASRHSFDVPHASPTANLIAILCLQVVYLTAGWSGERRTVGKALLGLRVVTDNGFDVSIGRAFLRAVVCTIIGGPLLLWAAVSPRNAALYDGPLHTAVVYRWYRASTRRPAPARAPQTATATTQSREFPLPPGSAAAPRTSG